MSQKMADLLWQILCFGLGLEVGSTVLSAGADPGGWIGCLVTPLPPMSLNVNETLNFMH